MPIMELPLDLQEAVLTYLSLTDVRDWACCCKASHSCVVDARRRAMEYLCMCDPSTPANWFAQALMDTRRQACARAASSLDIGNITQSMDVALLNSSGCGREIPAKYVPGYWIDIDSPCQHSLFTCITKMSAIRHDYQLRPPRKTHAPGPPRTPGQNKNVNTGFQYITFDDLSYSQWSVKPVVVCPAPLIHRHAAPLDRYDGLSRP